MKRKTKVSDLGVWDCLEQLQHESNPRLVALLERKDAVQLLKLRDALQSLIASGMSKSKIATAKRLLAQK